MSMIQDTDDQWDLFGTPILQEQIEATPSLYPTFEYLSSLEHMNGIDCWCFPEVMFYDPEEKILILKHHEPH